MKRRMYIYITTPGMAALATRDTKTKHLEQQGALNRHPGGVRAPWFQAAGGFFDARDLVQVKYEMLRQVSIEGATKGSTIYWL